MAEGNGFDEWGGYMGAKITKLEEQYEAASHPFRKSNLFEGISIFVNGRTNPTADQLKRLMMTYGGIYHHYERSSTTYIVAENLPDVKVRRLTSEKKNIIKPQWVVDCIKENRILDYTNYLLYTNQKTTQPSFKFQTNNSTTDKNNASLVDDKNCSEREIGKKAKIKTANDPDFIEEYYKNSRLHHISTFANDLKKYISDKRKNAEQKAFTTLKHKLNKINFKEDKVETWKPSLEGVEYVMHIDMDCFFVSVGLLKYPHLRGQPVVVSHSSGGEAATNVPVHAEADRQLERELWKERHGEKIRSGKITENFSTTASSLSEVASCSYEAREFGINNGMFMGQALKLCPHLQAIPYDFASYKKVAYQLYDIVSEYTLDIEPTSCDEMYVLLTPIIRNLHVDPMRIVSLIRQQVLEATGCFCSAGVGPNKLMARLATYRAKPNGQFQVKKEEIEEFMKDLHIKQLPGFSYSRLAELNLHPKMTCGELLQVPLQDWVKKIGSKVAEKLFSFSMGVDNRPLEYNYVRKSVSVDINYGMRFINQDQVNNFLSRLIKELHMRLLESGHKTKCITLKLMKRSADAPHETAKYMGHGICDKMSKSKTLNEFTTNINLISEAVMGLIKTFKVPPEDIRGIGIQFSKLYENDSKKDKAQPGIAAFFKNNLNKKEDKPTRIIQESSVLTDVTIDVKDKSNGINQPSISNQPTLNGFYYDGPSTSKGLRKTQPNEQVDCAKRAKPIESDELKERMEFLMALSPEIREEIMNNYGDMQEMEAQFALAKANNVSNSEEPNVIVIDEDNIFKRNDFPSFMIDWLCLEGNEGPNVRNIDSLIDHAIQMIFNDEHEDLYDKLLWLTEFMAKMNNGLNACKWHAAARRILDNVAEELCERSNDGVPYYFMKPVYCDNCKPKEDDTG